MRIGNYRVSWLHTNNGPQKRGSTQCIIICYENGGEDTDGQEVVSHTHSESITKHKGDPYDKNIGKYLSFKKTVTTILDRNIREQLWKGLKEQSPKTITKGSNYGKGIRKLTEESKAVCL